MSIRNFPSGITGAPFPTGPVGSPYRAANSVNQVAIAIVPGVTGHAGPTRKIIVDEIGLEPVTNGRFNPYSHIRAIYEDNLILIHLTSATSHFTYSIDMAYNDLSKWHVKTSLQKLSESEVVGVIIGYVKTDFYTTDSFQLKVLDFVRKIPSIYTIMRVHDS